MKVFIDGVRYVPADPQPDEITIYYMHDNHTFSRMNGSTLDEVLFNADLVAKWSPCGMLCAPRLSVDGKEVRRLKNHAHAPCVNKDDSRWIAGKADWRSECEADGDVMRLMAAMEGQKSEHI